MHKKDTHAFVNQLLVYTLVMFFFSGSIGLGTVWMRHQISITANSAKVLEGKFNEMERLINETHAAIERAQDPAMLKLLNDQWSLGSRRCLSGPPTSMRIRSCASRPNIIKVCSQTQQFQRSPFK